MNSIILVAGKTVCMTSTKVPFSGSFFTLYATYGYVRVLQQTFGRNSTYKYFSVVLSVLSIYLVCFNFLVFVNREYVYV